MTSPAQSAARYEIGGKTYTAAEMRAANESDDSFLEWLDSAIVGAVWDDMHSETVTVVDARAVAPHTPGPWSVRYGTSIVGGPFREYANGSCQDQIASVCVMQASEEGAVEQANARLIAAAPDLLELARRIAEHFEGSDAPLGIAARAAIAKATGDST